MRLIAIIIVLTALLGNIVYIGVNPPMLDAPPDDGTGDDGEGDDDQIISDITTLQVPPTRIGDQALYDYELFAEMYWENKTTGDYGQYTFEGQGTMLQFIDDPVDVEDGFLVSHNAVKQSFETKAAFEVTIKGQEDGKERDEVKIDGNLDVKRSEFTNIFDRHSLKSINTGSLTIEGVKALLDQNRDGPDLGGLDQLTYNADLKTYPDPHEEPVVSLDDSIYGMGQVLNLGSRETYEGDPVYGEANRYYNWSVTGAFKVQDFDTFRVNITSDIWGFLYFHREFYISEEYPFPIKGHTRTNTSYENDEEKFYVILETWQEVQDKENSVKVGDRDIQWGDPSGHEEYVDLHPAGEFERWEYVPKDGTDLDRSSFEPFTLNEAVDHAIENSDELQNFLNEYESKGLVLVEETFWNRSTEDNYRDADEIHRWNLTFSYVYEHDELLEYYDDWDEEEEDEEGRGYNLPEWRYTILVSRAFGFDGEEGRVDTYIEKDEGDDYHGYRKIWYGEGVMEDNLDLGNKILTLTHAEKILRIDNDVKDHAFKNNLLTDDTVFFYGIIGVNEENNQGLVLIEQLTGIQTPTADNAFSLKKAGVYETGSTFGAAVDANTGQLLYVNSIEGSELASLFGGK
ncbi:MAG: hypothetical protein U9R75_01525 [Candidatus Thermoplasmatota archaeon]|nr:hypothetical protein [Candidatus Thermoplasmatota archaeon]